MTTNHLIHEVARLHSAARIKHEKRKWWRAHWPIIAAVALALAVLGWQLAEWGIG